MKNLPEEEVFAELKHRLQNYSEDPDNDPWDKIAGAIPRQKYFLESAWADRLAGSLMVSLLIFLSVSNADNRRNKKWEKELLTSSSQNHSPAISSAQRNTVLNKETNTLMSQAPHTTSEMENTIIGNGNVEKYTTTNVARETDRDGIKIKDGKGRERTMEVNAIDSKKSSDILTSFSTIKNMDETGIRVTNEGLSTGEAVSVPGINSNSEINLKTATDSAAHTPVDSLYKMRKKKIQNKTTKRIRQFHSAFYLSVTPSLAYQKIVPFQTDEIVVNGLKPNGIFDSNRIGVSVEAGYQRRLSKKLEACFGVLYYQQNQQITYSYQSSGQVDVSSSGKDLSFSVVPSIQEKNVAYSMKNIGVSTGIFYLIRDGRLQHKVGLGLQYQRGFMNGGDDYKNSSSYYLNYQIVYRLEAPVGKKTTFFVQPTFNHVLTANEALQEPFSIKSYRAGMGFGIVYRF